MQCPLCGREFADLVGGICAEDAAKHRRFLELAPTIDVTTCAHCGRLRQGNQWVPAPTEKDSLGREVAVREAWIDPDLTDVKTTVDLRWEDPKNAHTRLALDAVYKGFPVHADGETRLRFKNGACNDCSREFGGYYEAILQVRGHEERVLNREIDRIERYVQAQMEGYRGEQRTGAFVSKSERVRGGLDYYLGSGEMGRLLGRSLAEKYGAEFGESSKLVGRRDGRDLYRSTYLVRLPPYAVGDFLSIDDRLFKLLRQDRKLLSLWDLERNESVHREPRLARKIKVVGTPEDEKDAIVVSFHGGIAQLLDPDTLRTVELRVESVPPQGSTIRVFRHDDKLYALPAAS